MCRPPDFMIIGAMKCATTTLHEQLARQPGIVMSRPKEPNFFSDDAVYAQGFDWYYALFQEPDENVLCGESSTHYTKLPTYPDTVGRMARALARIKFVYVMRHPIDRLISHYVHELSIGRITAGIHEAIDECPELIAYSRYRMQLAPYLETFGAENILPVFLKRLASQPQAELERIGGFLGHRGELRWDHAIKPQNVGSERLRRSTFREILVRSPVLTTLRRRMVPQPMSDSIKSLWRIRAERPRPTPELLERLRDDFDADLEQLGAWLGVRLDCDRFHEVTEARTLEWTETARRL